MIEEVKSVFNLMETGNITLNGLWLIVSFVKHSPHLTTKILKKNV